MNLPPRPKKANTAAKQDTKTKPKKAVHGPDDSPTEMDGNAPGDGEERQKDEGIKRSKLSAVKEQIKRPLSSLLRRPGSRSGSRDRERDRDGPESIEVPPGENGNLPPELKPAKKMGGWGSGDVAERPSSRMFNFGRGGSTRRSQDLGIDETVSFVTQNDDKKMVELQDEVVEDGRNIQQLEEIAGNDYGTQVAQAPSIPVNRVATFKELDNALLKNPVFTSLEGDFDLSILAKCLCPESDIKEEAVAWTWDYLFTSISAELRKEWEEQKTETSDGGQMAELGQQL